MPRRTARRRPWPQAARADPSVLDAGLIAGAQKVEHYEVATYGTLRTWARQLGNQEAARQLE